MSKFLLFFIILCLSNVAFAQKYRTERKPLNNVLIQVNQYYQNGQKYRTYYERHNKRDSLYKRWNKQGKLVREGYYKSGKKRGVWKKWFFNEEDTPDYQEVEYNSLEKLTEVRHYYIGDHKRLYEKFTYQYKGDSTITKEILWNTKKPYEKYEQCISIKLINVHIYQQCKEWNEKGVLLSERSYKKEGKYSLDLERDWNTEGKLINEEWFKRWKETTVDGYEVKQKLLRRKTYKDGKLVKDEKFE